jgi:hypothetical protein
MIHRKEAEVKIRLTHVKSSNIKGHGYDAESKTLAVQFTSGTTYHYTDVPPEIAATFALADSLGTYFAQHIRPHFKHTKIHG